MSKAQETFLRYLWALSAALLIAGISIHTQWAFAGGWWACCAWLLITKQWRPFI